MKYLIIFSFASLTTLAQDPQVMEPVNLLFEGMKKGDSAMVHRAFKDGADLYTVATERTTGKPVVRREALQTFLNAVGKPHKEVWNEPIWAPKIEVDGNFAQVWVNYAFYTDTTFSHCGVDAFHLYKTETGSWKIFVLTDTRRRTGCEVPKEVSDKLK